MGKSTIRIVMRMLRINHRPAPRILLMLIFLLGVAAVAISCNKGPSTPQPIQDLDGLVRALREAGANIEAVSRTTSIVDLPEPQFYLLDGALVQIGAAGMDSSELEGLASANAELHLWFGGGWYLAYAGREGGVILLLSGLLGDPVQATPIALEEPFPPAIPRAMRRLSDDLSVSPSQLTVVDFQPAIWPDACLGIETQAADCTPGDVAGWTLTLLLDEKIYKLHTDEVGEIVRWDDPAPRGEE